MYPQLKLTLAVVALSTIALAQNAPTDGPFQVKYAAKLDVADSDIFFTNTGVNVDQSTGSGDICVNTYVFAYDEQLASCCSCKVTRNALWLVSARQDLVAHALTPDPTLAQKGIVIKLLATLPVGGVCDATNPGPLTRGMAAWGTSTHDVKNAANVVVGRYGTETPFTNSTLSPGERGVMSSFCGFIKANGSGYGACTACQTPIVLRPAIE